MYALIEILNTECAAIGCPSFTTCSWVHFEWKGYDEHASDL
jgi:hypothetical protein